MADNMEMLRLRAKAKAKASLEQEQAVTAPREQMREVIKQMESGGNYKADHPAFNEAGEKAVGAYGVVPRFWFGEFPELGLDSKKPEDIARYENTPALQDTMFSRIYDKGMKAVGNDPVKFRAWFYGGPKAVKALEKGKGNAPVSAYNDTGEKIAMPTVSGDSQKFQELLGDNLTPENLQTLNTRKLAGLPDLPYPNREADDPANTLYNDPQAQAEAVQAAQQQAVTSLPIREQMGSGVGAWAYKFPGMGKLASMSGLAPKGANKEEELAFYNKNRSGMQLAGEMVPDVLAASLGGVATTRALPKIANTSLRRFAEGGAAGLASAGIHQAQHIGSGEGIKPVEGGLEVAVSAALPVVGGKLGDAFKLAAPKMLKRAIGSTAKNVDYKNALDEGMVPKIFGSAEDATNKRVSELTAEQSAEALKASQRPANIKAPTPPGSAVPKTPPIKGMYTPTPRTPAQAAGFAATQPAPTPTTNLNQMAGPQIPVRTPGQFPRDPNTIGPVPRPPYRGPKPEVTFTKDAETLAKESRDAAEADLAKRKAAAEARRNPKTEKPTKLSDFADGPKAEKFSFKMEPKDEAQQATDDELLAEAFKAEKALSVQKKLKGQRGAIPNPFAKSKPTPQTAPQMVESRKVAFNAGPLANARKAIGAEMATPAARTLKDTEYDKALQTLDQWEAEAKARPTTRGGKRSQMTVEDAVALADVIEKSITPGETGANKASKILLQELRNTIKDKAPEVADVTEKLSKAKGFQKALNTKSSGIKVAAAIKLATMAGGGITGALKSDKNSRTKGAVTGALGALTLAQLASTPGGAAIIYKVGKAMADRSSVRGNTLAQFARSSTVKSREK